MPKPVVIESCPDSKLSVTETEWWRRFEIKGAMGDDRWGWKSIWIWPGSQASIPTCQRVTNFQVGARHWQAKSLRSKESLGLQQGPLYWPGDNGWELTWHTMHTTLLQRLSRQSKHTADQSHQESSLLVIQHGHCMWNLWCTPASPRNGWSHSLSISKGDHSTWQKPLGRWHVRNVLLIYCRVFQGYYINVLQFNW